MKVTAFEPFPPTFRHFVEHVKLNKIKNIESYNLALGERRANAAKDYLMTYGISADRISVISYGKERPVDAGSNPLSWSKNRRSVTVKAN